MDTSTLTRIKQRLFVWGVGLVFSLAGHLALFACDPYGAMGDGEDEATAQSEAKPLADDPGDDLDDAADSCVMASFDIALTSPLDDGAIVTGLEGGFLALGGDLIACDDLDESAIVPLQEGHLLVGSAVVVELEETLSVASTRDEIPFPWGASAQPGAAATLVPITALEALGLAPGDLLLAVDGTAIKDGATLVELLLAGIDTGTITLDLLRGGTIITRTYHLADTSPL